MVAQMSSDFLSQEEIDALLHGGATKKEINPDDYLSMFDRDALGEVGNISFGTAATTLSTLLRQKVNITTPQVTLLLRDQFVEDFPVPHVAARVEYTEGLQGSNFLMIRIDDAQIIADLMLGGDGRAPAAELNELHMSAVGEAMNQMMGSASTSMATMVGRAVNISPPVVQLVDATTSSSFVPDSDILVRISFHLTVGDLIDSNIMQVIPIEFARSLVDMVMGTHRDNTVESDDPMPDQGTFFMDDVMVETAAASSTYQMATNAYTAAMATEPYGGISGTAAKSSTPVQPIVEKAVFSAFDDPGPPRSGRNLDLLLDIPLQLTVELGRTKKLIRDILDFAPGSIIELDALAGEPVDILVNHKLIARGEVVVIDENFGVRVTDIISPAERIARLQ